MANKTDDTKAPQPSPAAGASPDAPPKGAEGQEEAANSQDITSEDSNAAAANKQPAAASGATSEAPKKEAPKKEAPKPADVYTVVRRFQDAEEYRLGGKTNTYEVGTDVSHLDPTRLAALVARGNVRVESPAAPAA